METRSRLSWGVRSRRAVYTWSAMVSRWTRQCALGVSCIIALACQQPTDPYRQVSAAQMDTVAVLPMGIYHITVSPDSTLFVSGFDGSIFRSAIGGAAPWELVVPPDADYGRFYRSLYARSRTEVFAYSRAQIWRWIEGDTLRIEPTETEDPMWCGDFVADPNINAMISAGDRGVFAVGDHGLILRRTDSRWVFEPNVLADSSPSLCYQSFPTDLRVVGFSDDYIYAGAAALVRSRGDGNWERVPTPGDAVDSDPALVGIVSGPDAVFAFGYYSEEAQPPRPYRFFRRDVAETWRQVASIRAGVILELHPGAMQPGGPGLFWSWGGRVLQQHGARLRFWKLESSTRIRGTASIGQTIFVANMESWTHSVVVRLRD